MVDTGQELCYDGDGSETACPAAGEAFYGQDAQYDGNQPSHSDNGDGTVTDNISGLMWQQSPDTDGDGDIDWRLPDIKALYSLIDFRGVDPSGYDGGDPSGLIPFIDTTYFDFAYGDTAAGERIIDAQYASSTPYVDTTPEQRLFGVNFVDPDGGESGLGLAIVRSIVELHGGSISVDSSPGQGTMFTIVLPVGGAEQ